MPLLLLEARAAARGIDEVEYGLQGGFGGGGASAVIKGTGDDAGVVIAGGVESGGSVPAIELKW